jgi:hypothetical protein
MLLTRIHDIGLTFILRHASLEGIRSWLTEKPTRIIDIQMAYRLPVVLRLTGDRSGAEDYIRRSLRRTTRD